MVKQVMACKNFANFFAKKTNKIAIEPIKITILLNATLCNMLTYVSMSPFCLGRELHFCQKDLPCLEMMMSLPIYHRIAHFIIIY